MNNDAFTSVYIEDCRRQGHHLRLVGSDKTPMRRSLICKECSERTGKSAYAAYPAREEPTGVGQWRETRRELDEV